MWDVAFFSWAIASSMHDAYRYVGCYILHVGYYSIYVGCCRFRVGCFILCACCTGIMWDITSSMHTAHAICGLLQALCGLSRPRCGLLQPACMLHRSYVGYCIIYMNCYSLYVGCYWRRQRTKSEKEDKKRIKGTKTGNQDRYPKLRTKTKNGEQGIRKEKTSLPRFCNIFTVKRSFPVKKIIFSVIKRSFLG